MRGVFGVVMVLVACGEPAEEPSGDTDPVVPVVRITPELPTSVDPLRAVVDEPEGAVWRYTWLRDGEVVEGLTGAAIGASETLRGETWSVEVRPADAPKGPPGEAQVEVGNAAPVFETLNLNPDPLTVDDDATVRAITRDPDSDALTYSFAWTVDGVAQDATGNTLSEGFGPGDVVAVEITADDGFGGVITQQLEREVINRPPPAPRLPLRGATTPPRVRNLSCAPTSTPRDPDGDEIVGYEIVWRLNGVLFTETVPDAEGLPEVPRERQAEGQVWDCEVRADDGTALSPPATDTLTLQNSGSRGGFSTISVTGSGNMAFEEDPLTLCGGDDCDCTASIQGTGTLEFYVAFTATYAGTFTVLGSNCAPDASTGADLAVQFLEVGTPAFLTVTYLPGGNTLIGLTVHGTAADFGSGDAFPGQTIPFTAFSRFDADQVITANLSADLVDPSFTVVASVGGELTVDLDP